MINLVMAIGFAVDYSAHLAHSFVFSNKNNPEERIVDALRTVGASVMMGGKIYIGYLFTNLPI
jgi:predicted RND superfamily exporter protein